MTDEWRNQAKCLGADTSIFFLEVGETATRAREMCGRCKVTDQCLAYAIDSNQELGVWGGKTARERRKLRATMRTP